MAEMNLSNVLNFVGILLGLVGAVLLFFIDLPLRKLAVAEKAIPNNPCLDAYNARKVGGEHTPSPGERTYNALANEINPDKALRIFRFAIGLIVLGFTCQLVAASTNWSC